MEEKHRNIYRYYLGKRPTIRSSVIEAMNNLVTSMDNLELFPPHRPEPGEKLCISFEYVKEVPRVVSGPQQRPQQKNTTKKVKK